MTITHKWQKAGHTCGAASVAMILGITEEAARKLAGTTRRGTNMLNAAEALRTSGKPVYSVHVSNIPMSIIGWQLETQSMRWPLLLHIGFPEKFQGKRRIVTKNREHAVVLYQGKLYDPGEVETLSVDTIGHLSDGEAILRSYILVEIDAP